VTVEEDNVDPQGDDQESNEAPASAGVSKDVEQPEESNTKEDERSTPPATKAKQSKSPVASTKAASSKGTMNNSNTPPTPLVRKVCGDVLPSTVSTKRAHERRSSTLAHSGPEQSNPHH
jgi:hypothetical protein